MKASYKIYINLLCVVSRFQKKFDDDNVISNLVKRRLCILYNLIRFFLVFDELFLLIDYYQFSIIYIFAL